jgi:hypothetical protein
MARLFDAAAAHLAGLGGDKMRDLGFAVQVEPGHGILHDPISVGDALVLAQMFPSTIRRGTFRPCALPRRCLRKRPRYVILGNKQRHDGLPGRDVKAPAAPMRNVNKSKLPGVAKPNPTITA